MDAGIGEIAVHAVNFRQIGAAALRADVHLELLISAVVAVSQRQVDAFVQAELHGAAHQRADGFLVVAVYDSHESRQQELLHLADVYISDYFDLTSFWKFASVE